MSASRDDGDARKLFCGYEPTRRDKGKETIGSRTAFPVQETIEQGKAVIEYAKLHFGAAELEAGVASGKLRVPHGFWLRFLQDCLKRTPT